MAWLDRPRRLDELVGPLPVRPDLDVAHVPAVDDSAFGREARLAPPVLNTTL